MNTRTDDDDDKRIAKDGERITVSVMMMDSLQRVVSGRGSPPILHRPGPILADAETDKRRRALYEAADKRLSDAWRNPPAVAADTKPPAAKGAPAALDREAMYARRDRQLSEAWEGSRSMRPALDPLPPAARAKLISLEGQRDDARDAAASAGRRLDELQRQLGYSATPLDGAANIEHEMTRLRAVRERQNHRFQELGALVSNIRRWLETLPTGAALEAVRPATVKPNKDETLPAAVARLREEISTAKVALRAVAVAPLPRADLKLLAKEHVAALAEKGRPKVSTGRGGLTVSYADANAYSFAAAQAAQMLAWLDPARMTKRLEAEIDALPEPALALTAAEKATRTDELTANIEQLERFEDALIERAHAEGLDLLRRSDAAPTAVLACRFAARKVAAA